jgi:tRNA (guanine10-N2)-dimethyltransferase
VSPDLFFLLSGEHDTLPAAEVLAILESEDFAYHNWRLLPKLLTLEASQDCLQRVIERAGMCEAAGQLIFMCRNNQDEILKSASETPFSRYLEYRSRFSVRVRRAFGSAKHLNKIRLESELGRMIRTSAKSDVDLMRPENEFLGIIGGGHFAFGLIGLKRSDDTADLRRPKHRPATHPSTLKPRLARCFVNLSRARKGGVLVDPFCGTGGILIEGGVMGCRIVGLDLDPLMIRRARRNIRHFGIRPEGLILADAKVAPYSQVRSIATDPPYGRGASTMGADLARLLREFLKETHSILAEDGFVCLGSPAGTDIDVLGLEAGLNLVESHIARVHKSLSRRIVVFSRKRIERRVKVPWSSYS